MRARIPPPPVYSPHARPGTSQVQRAMAPGRLPLPPPPVYNPHARPEPAPVQRSVAPGRASAPLPPVHNPPARPVPRALQAKLPQPGEPRLPAHPTPSARTVPVPSPVPSRLAPPRLPSPVLQECKRQKKRPRKDEKEEEARPDDGKGKKRRLASSARRAAAPRKVAGRARGTATFRELNAHARALLDAYGKAFQAEHKRPTKEKIENVTSGVAAFYESDEDDEELIATPQRSYAAMRGKAAELGISRVLPRSHIPNIHSEMIALYTLFQRRDESATPHTHLRCLGVSKEICFLCQVMLTLFNVDYDRAYVSRNLYSGWKDPTGYIERADRKGLATPRYLLTRLGMSVPAAIARLRALIADDGIIASILDGGLQGAALRATIKRLTALDKSLVGSGGAKGARVRRPAPNTKSGRRLLRLLRAARAKGAGAKGGGKKPGARGAYAPTAAQNLAFAADGRRLERIAPDGDCLYAALIRLGAYVGTIAQFRRRIAIAVRLGEIDTSGFNLDPVAITRDIVRVGSYDNLGGDVAPSIIAQVLGITIIIYNEDGNTTTLNGGTHGTFHLVRVTHPLPHYHAAR
jgi:hypothetical protein